MKRFRNTVIRAGLEALYFSGAHYLLRPIFAGVGAIFMLHHVRPCGDAAFQPNHHLEVEPDFLRAMLAHLRTLGLPVIVSDGDSVYQPLKIERSGLAAAVDGQVLVFIHKEAHLEEIMARWPSELYVMVHDKANILAETKRRFPDRFVKATGCDQEDRSILKCNRHRQESRLITLRGKATFW